MSILKLENISYTYEGNSKKVLDNISYNFEKGKIYAIVGKSGAGKTTLLSLLSALTHSTEGNIYFEDDNIKKINQYEYRSRKVGVVFQGYNLLPQLTALENVILSIDISGEIKGDKNSLAKEMLERVSLNDEKGNRKILKLSGGEQQRVSIARALSYNPEVILADEPTGNLDKETEKSIMGIFTKLAREDDKCVIIVTHSPEVAKYADETIKIEKGKIV